MTLLAANSLHAFRGVVGWKARHVLLPVVCCGIPVRQEHLAVQHPVADSVAAAGSSGSIAVPRWQVCCEAQQWHPVELHNAQPLYTRTHCCTAGGQLFGGSLPYLTRSSAFCNACAANKGGHKTREM